ncbi:MAG: ATP/GTP-binding protein [Methylovulum sp.]|nr:ATP/GTP-binding protein [Methylovulum sp.]
MTKENFEDISATVLGQEVDIKAIASVNQNYAEMPESANEPSIVTPLKKKTPILKFVFTGSVGSGKTTAIATISENSYFSTEVKPSEQNVLQQKKTTTVAMDYGVLKTLDGEDKFYLYGTPGQRRFDFMTPILTRDAAGLIIMINNTHENPLDDLEYYLSLNKGFLLKNPAVIGITHYDRADQPSIEDYLDILNERGIPWPVMHIDARELDDILLLLDTLVMMVEFG